MQLYEQVTSVVQELQSKFPMPSESKLRSIYREVLQDRIIIKSIFSITKSHTFWEEAKLKLTVSTMFVQGKYFWERNDRGWFKVYDKQRTILEYHRL